MSEIWTEVGERVFVRRYRFYNQNIVAIIGRDETLVIDTRISHRQAAEIQADLRVINTPPVTVVVNTHGHSDHAFGNHAFRPCAIWGHVRCPDFMRAGAEPARAWVTANMPGMAEEMAEVVIDPPDRTFDLSAKVEFGGREVELRYLGRGHTDNDVVILVPDADVVCAGDLLENGATPYFGDGFPMDWPATAEALLELIGHGTVVVPGHGDHAGREFAATSAAQFRDLAVLAARVQAGDLDLEGALELAPFPVESARDPLARAVAQMRGEVS